MATAVAALIFCGLLTFLALGTDGYATFRVELKPVYNNTYYVYEGHGSRIVYRVKSSRNKVILIDNTKNTTLSVIKKTGLRRDNSWKIFIGHETKPRYIAKKIPNSIPEIVNVQINPSRRDIAPVSFAIQGKYSPRHKLCNILGIFKGVSLLGVEIRPNDQASDHAFIVKIVSHIASELALAMVNLLEKMYG